MPREGLTSSKGDRVLNGGISGEVFRRSVPGGKDHMDIIISAFLLAAALFAACWLSPRALSWIAAKAMARRDAIIIQRRAMAWWLSRFDEEG